jgi:hypothetical protein
MSSNKTASETLDLAAALKPAGAKFFAEDGWLFSQVPGKGVECLRRIDEASVVSQLNVPRENFQAG